MIRSDGSQPSPPRIDYHRPSPYLYPVTAPAAGVTVWVIGEKIQGPDIAAQIRAAAAKNTK